LKRIPFLVVGLLLSLGSGTLATIYGFRADSSSGQLAGIVEYHQLLPFHWENFYTGTFQKSFETYFDEHFEHRSWFIRLENSINAWFFYQGKLPNPLDHYSVELSPFNEPTWVNFVIFGSRHVLFYDEDINFLNRTDFHLNEKMTAKIHGLQKMWSDHEKVFLPLIIPSKVHFYANDIPELWLTGPSHPRPSDQAYETFRKDLSSTGVRFVDLLDQLMAIHSRSQIPIYNKTGRHWNHWGACLALQQIVKAVPKRTDYEVSPPNCSDFSMRPAHDADLDLWNGLNIWNWGRLKFEAPEMAANPSVGGYPRKPSALYIGTSFAWELRDEALRNQTFSRFDVFYYNRAWVRDSGARGPLPATAAEWRQTVFSYDIVIIDFFESYLPWIINQDAFDFFSKFSEL
jgi:hypothetical protein